MHEEIFWRLKNKKIQISLHFDFITYFHCASGSCLPKKLNCHSSDRIIILTQFLLRKHGYLGNHLRGHSLTMLTRFWLFFDHLPSSIDILHFINLKSWHFWTIPKYHPCLVNVVKEYPLTICTYFKKIPWFLKISNLGKVPSCAQHFLDKFWQIILLIKLLKYLLYWRVEFCIKC